jgi:thiamine-phosphate pyrophosphorylase
MKADYRLYVIVDPEFALGRPVGDVAAQAIQGGATCLQLRMKHASTREFIEAAYMLAQLCKAADVPLVINDRADVAWVAGVDGVHVGQEDMPAADARRLLGDQAIVGVSAATPSEATAAAQAGAEYLGVGDVFGTATKAEAGAPIGLEGLARVVQAVSVPVVAIGGVNHDNAARAIAAGAAGVAVISAVVSAADVADAARRLRRVVDEAMRMPTSPPVSE